MKEYALYKGDEILSIGTIEEIAEEQKVKKRTVNFYKTPTYEKRIENRKSKKARILIEVEDDEDERNRV